MTCPRCGKDVWDNRLKKMDDPKWKNAADFTCKDKSCGWKAGDPVGAPTLSTAPAATPTPAINVSRDAAIQVLFWDSFDAVMAGIQKRKLTDMFHGENVCALTATLFIQRTKG